MNPEHVPSPTDETDVTEGHLPDTVTERVPKPLFLSSSSGHQQDVSTSQPQEDITRREVACQTDPVIEVSHHTDSVNQSGLTVAKVENRATQTEPATRSVFTRSSRFLPAPSENVLDRPHTTSMAPSHRGDSTAVLSSGRGRGRFRGRGHNRMRPRRAVSLPNVTVNPASTDQIDSLSTRSVGRGAGTSFFSNGGASTPNDILALLEARLGETRVLSSSTRSLQDPPAPPPVSPTEATPLTQSATSETLSVKVVAQNVDSLSTSENFTILSPKLMQHAVAKPSMMMFGAKRQHHREFSTWTTEVDSISDRSQRIVPSSHEAHLSAAINLPSMAAGGSNHAIPQPPPLLSAFEGLNVVDSPEVRNRRRGVRGFLSRLLGKESMTGHHQKGLPGAKTATVQVDSDRTFSEQQRQTSATTITTTTASNSDSSG